MKKLFNLEIILTGLFLLFFGCGNLSGAGTEKYTLAKDKKTDYVLVLKDEGSTAAENFAAEELKNHFTKITGIELKVVKESELKDAGKKIYVGQTNFAKKSNVDFAKLRQEEWVIKTVDGNLILSGGRPRGTIYAVYEFLEKFAGCHWLAEDTTVIPAILDFSIPSIDITEKPAFWFRIFASPIQSDDINKSMAFLARNKSNRSYLDAKYGFIEREGSPGGVHTFYAYSKDWPVDHPEYFSMNTEGKRLKAINGSGPGQICLTNPEARKLTYEKLKSFIQADRKKAVNGGYPPPKVYDISHNDNNNPCVCPSCKALMEKEGAYSGVMLDFINDIADRIKSEYPDVIIQTFAYIFTIEPPKTLKPRDNVMIRVCNLGTEFPGEGISEPIRSINSDFNNKFRGYLDRWSEISKNISVWDYWILYTKTFSYPYIDLNKICNDMKYFKKSNAQSILVECEFNTTSFYPLKRWLSFKLMDAPAQDTKTLIKTFMDGFYGPASDDMTKYLNYLDAKTAAEQGSLSSRPPYQYGYLADKQFYKDINSMLDSAETKCKSNPLYLNHVNFERVAVDSSLLYMWSKLEKKNAEKALPFDREKIIERYRNNKALLIGIWGNWSKSKEARLTALDSEIKALQLSIPLPKEFEDKDVIDMIWIDFKEMGYACIVDDPSASGGKGMKLNDVKDIPEHKDRTDFHAKNFTMGIYNKPTKKFAINFELKEVPADEKYHLYKIGKFNFIHGTIFWAHYSWLIQINIDKCYDPLLVDNERDVYVSVKLTGPSYVPGSSQPDAVWIDRIIAVKTEKQ